MSREQIRSEIFQLQMQLETIERHIDYLEDENGDDFEIDELYREVRVIKNRIYELTEDLNYSTSREFNIDELEE